MTVLMRCLAVSLVCFFGSIAHAQEGVPSNAGPEAAGEQAPAPESGTASAAVGAAAAMLGKLAEAEGLSAHARAIAIRGNR